LREEEIDIADVQREMSIGKELVEVRAKLAEMIKN
jgi:hypothetical protein